MVRPVDPCMEPDVLEKKIGYVFGDKGLLTTALTHRSYGAGHNERLEFLGDGVLNCVIAAVLFERFTHLPEGDLSRLRAHLVCQDTLHQLALQLDMGEFLRLGDGEVRSGGRRRPSILADTLEALFGAMYLESGFEAVGRVIRTLYVPKLEAIAPGQSMKDSKTRLQEWLQGRRKPLPRYQLLETTGAAHDQSFHVACQIESFGVSTQGVGPSRRIAEQDAAQKALEELSS